MYDEFELEGRQIIGLPIGDALDLVDGFEFTEHRHGNAVVVELPELGIALQYDEPDRVVVGVDVGIDPDAVLGAAAPE